MMLGTDAYRREYGGRAAVLERTVLGWAVSAQVWDGLNQRWIYTMTQWCGDDDELAAEAFDDLKADMSWELLERRAGETLPMP